VPELGVFRVRHVEVLLGHELRQDVFRHLAVVPQDDLPPREPRRRLAAGNDAEGRDARGRKRLDVIAPEKQDDVGLGFVEHGPELAHGRRGLFELLRVLVRRVREQIRRMASADGGNDFTHGWFSSTLLEDLHHSGSSSTYCTPSSASFARNP
jgi:hypothetical protein